MALKQDSIKWETVETQSSSSQHFMERASVPGGWLLRVSIPFIQGGWVISSMMFYPDPGHSWDGAST